MEPTTAAIETAKSAMIFDYGTQMTIIFLIAIGMYTIVSLRSWRKILDWYRANAIRVFIAFGLFWLISSAIVVIPNFSEIVGLLGFNFDQGTAGIGAIIAALLIKNQSEPETAVPVEIVGTPNNPSPERIADQIDQAAIEHEGPRDTFFKRPPSDTKGV